MKLDLAEILQEAERVIEKSQLKHGAQQRFKELKELGFTALAEQAGTKIKKNLKLAEITRLKYTKITVDKIKAFLKRKAEEYNKLHPKKEIKVESSEFRLISTAYAHTNGIFYMDDMDSVYSIDRFSEQTNDYLSSDKNTIGRFEWIETRIDQVKSLPPKNILRKLSTHKRRKLFDYFTIAKVEGLYDPILFGRIKGSEDRFFIAQWGEDVSLDDVI